MAVEGTAVFRNVFKYSLRDTKLQLKRVFVHEIFVHVNSSWRQQFEHLVNTNVFKTFPRLLFSLFEEDFICCLLDFSQFLRECKNGIYHCIRVSLGTLLCSTAMPREQQKYCFFFYMWVRWNNQEFSVFFLVYNQINPTYIIDFNIIFYPPLGITPPETLLFLFMFQVLNKKHLAHEKLY